MVFAPLEMMQNPTASEQLVEEAQSVGQSVASGCRREQIFKGNEARTERIFVPGIFSDFCDNILRDQLFGVTLSEPQTDLTHQIVTIPRKNQSYG